MKKCQDGMKILLRLLLFEELPENCQKYLRRIEELINCPIAIFSVGPDREQTICVKRNFLNRRIASEK